MMSKSLCELVKCRWREFTREPSACFFVIFMPIFAMLVLGGLFSKPAKEHYTVALQSSKAANWDKDNKMKTKKILQQRPEIDLLDGSRDFLQKQLKNSSLDLLVGFNESGLVYQYDVTNKQAILARRFVDTVLQEGFGRKNPVITESRPSNVAGSRYIDFLIPGLLALSLLTTSLYGTGMCIVSNRRENLLKRYKATPMSGSQFILSHIIGRYLIMSLEILSVLLTAYLLFSFKVQGSLGLFLFLCLLGTSCFTSLAMLCSSRLANAASYNGFVNLLILPMMFLSGIWFGRQGFPVWLIPVTEFLPLTALGQALRAVALDASRLADIWSQILLLTSYTAVFFVFARKRFSWR